MVPNADASADDDRRTNNATTGATLHEAEADAYTDTQRPSSNLVYTQVPAASACGDGIASPDATADSGTSADIFAPDDHSTSTCRRGSNEADLHASRLQMMSHLRVQP